MELGGTIRRLREDRGISSGELAKLAGVSRGYLWQLETGGKDRPSFDVLNKLACALEVDVSEFAERDRRPPQSDLPAGLLEFYNARSADLGVTGRDVELMRNVQFRGKQPTRPEDWELLFLFLKKWAG